MNRHHGMTEGVAGPRRLCTPRTGPAAEPDRFGRLFPELPANYTPSDLLAAIGVAGGPMDGPQIRTDTVPVGHVIFGQFIDHDITLDVTSSLHANAGDTQNVRTPTLDLDCIYGDGPEAHPFMYRDGVRLVTGADTAGATPHQQEDLARAANDRAIIGDFRNDENRVISQMQLGMIRFHNNTCDRLEAEGHAGKELYELARHEVTWHYQWCVVFDFLVAMCGERVVDDILVNGRKFYCGFDEPFIPVEFSVAAYRFGHSMVPDKIQVQAGATAYSFFGTTLGRGFAPLTSDNAIVDWHEVFDTSAARQVQRADRLDTTMASMLLNLPIPGAAPDVSLAGRNLRRGNVFRLPSGENIARAMGIEAAQIAIVTDKVNDIATAAGADRELVGSPLWLYILAEAEVIGRAEVGGGTLPGEGLGPVGGRIVAEVLIGLLELDENSFLGANRNWTPDDAYASIGELLASTATP